MPRCFRAKRAASVAALALLLGGCAGLTSKAPPPAFDIAAAQSFPRYSGKARGQLIISEPTALAVLDSEKIVVRPGPGETATFSDAQWQDRLPKLLQARILQSFENASRLRAVGRPGERIAGDFQLVVDIRAFELLASRGVAQVEIAAKIVRERSGRIMAARVFRASVPTTAVDGPDAVAALNEAFAKVATEMVLWAARLI